MTGTAVPATADMSFWGFGYKGHREKFMNAQTVRAIHLPQPVAHRLQLPTHLLLMGALVTVAFFAIWIAVVADALHPYGK